MKNIQNITNPDTNRPSSNLSGRLFHFQLETCTSTSIKDTLGYVVCTGVVIPQTLAAAPPRESFGPRRLPATV